MARGPRTFYQLPLAEIRHLPQALDEAEQASLKLILVDHGKPLAMAARDTTTHRDCSSWEQYLSDWKEWENYSPGTPQIRLTRARGFAPYQRDYFPAGKVMATLSELQLNARPIIWQIARTSMLSAEEYHLTCYVQYNGAPLAKLTAPVRT